MRVVLLFLAFAAQDPTRDGMFERDITDAIEKLKSDRYREILSAKRELIEIGRLAVPAVVQALRDENAEVKLRRTLVEILAGIRHNSDEAVQVLIEKLKDMDEYGTSVAAAAAEALERLGDDRAIDPLIAALQSRDAETDKYLKYHCIHALGVFRATKAVNALIPALEDTKVTGGDSEWGHNIAAAAADALARIRAKGAIDALGEQLAGTEIDPVSRRSIGNHVARALEQITGETKGNLNGDPTARNEALQEWKDWNSSRVTRKRIAEIGAAVEKFRTEQGKVPASLRELKIKPADATSWPKKGYFGGEFTDGWARPLVYQVPGENDTPFTLLSKGRDNEDGGEGVDADLRWEK